MRSRYVGKVMKSDNMLVISDNELFSPSFIEKVSHSFVKLRRGLQVKIMGGEWSGHWGKVQHISTSNDIKILLADGSEVSVLYKNLFAF